MISGLCPFHVTCTITCGGERSGRASKGVFFIDQIDPTMIKSVAIRTRKRFLTLKDISFSIIIIPGCYLCN
jgi:hypothetical protein